MTGLPSQDTSVRHTNLSPSTAKKKPSSWAKVKQSLSSAIERARNTLESQQHPEGYWCFELEADCTIPAEYIFLMHYIDDIDEDLQAKIANYLRKNQGGHGGWPLYYGGDFDLSCSVKAYYALKLAGDSLDAPHMQTAREAILQAGGAAKANVFTRILLAFFGQIPWRAVPFLPVEIMLLPKWFPFHISKVSYWSRTVMVPLSILCSLKPQAKNPQRTHIRELFLTPPELENDYFSTSSTLNKIFLALDLIGKTSEPFIPKRVREHAIKRAETWFVERLNGEDGLGGIFPAKVYAYKALVLLGYQDSHPYVEQTKIAINKLLVINEEHAYCQPCLSPVWDTGLANLALQELSQNETTPSIKNAFDWLKGRQILEDMGDWKEKRPNLESGGWAFQFSNGHYPDLDDTAVVGWGMHQASTNEDYQLSIERAANWLVGMQSKNGGFAAFDVDNMHYYLNEIPFADHGALLDPPTCDVSARCLAFLGRLNREEDQFAIKRCLKYVLDSQEEDGSWYGRWGTNYIYGTWSVLSALEQINYDTNKPEIQKAVLWLKKCQREDGGWGEDNFTYFEPAQRGSANESTAFHTALALLALLSSGEEDTQAVHDGIAFLLSKQDEDGLWSEPWYTAPGFPRVFYLRYHGYCKYFPLWALAKYRNKLGLGV